MVYLQEKFHVKEQCDMMKAEVSVTNEQTKNAKQYHPDLLGRR